MRTKTHAVFCTALAAGVTLLACGDNNPTAPAEPNTSVVSATPTPAPTPSVPLPCQLTAPTRDCSTRDVRSQELADALQAGIDTAVGTPGVMYADYPNRVYDLDRFRSRVVETLTAKGVCGAWDYGNVIGDEIYVRSADGCVVEQYDILTGSGAVRNAGRASNAWQEGWGVPVPAAKPSFPKEGDLACSLPGDRATFCFGIRGSHGRFGEDVFRLVLEVLNQNPELVDKADYLAGQGELVPEGLRLPAWRITNPRGFIAAVEAKLRSAGYCAFIEKGDVLKVKQVALGNVLHEEIDVIQDPATGGSYTSFTVKDRCHNAGF